MKFKPEPVHVPVYYSQTKKEMRFKLAEGTYLLTRGSVELEQKEYIDDFDFLEYEKQREVGDYEFDSRDDHDEYEQKKRYADLDFSDSEYWITLEGVEGSVDPIPIHTFDDLKEFLECDEDTFKELLSLLLY